MLSALAWLAIVPYILGAFMKTPRWSLAFFLIGNGLYISYYFLSGIYAPAINLTAISCITLLVIIIPARYLIPTVLTGFALTAIPIITHMQSAFDMAMIAAAGLNFFAQYNRDNTLHFKCATLGAQILWVGFTLHVGDVPMLLCTSLFASALAISMLRQISIKPVAPDPMPL